MAKVDSEGRLTLPEDICEELDIEPGTEVEVREQDGNIVIVPENHPQKTIDRMERLISEAQIRREIRADETTPLDDISPQAQEFADDVRRGAQQADNTEMDDSERLGPVERISGTLANVDAESDELKDSIGEIIVRKQEHSNGAPTIEGTGIRVKDIAGAYEHSGYGPDEITELYPDLSLADVHYALGYYYEHIHEFR